MYHEIALQLYDGRLHLAPLKDPQRVLDIGTGTGIWAIDMADTYPSAEVIGIDLRHAACSLALSAVYSLVFCTQSHSARMGPSQL